MTIINNLSNFHTKSGYVFKFVFPESKVIVRMDAIGEIFDCTMIEKKL